MLPGRRIDSCRSTQAVFVATLVVLIIGSSAGCIETTPTAENDGPAVGALLPFTGDLAAEGHNLEKALLLASEGFTDHTDVVDGGPVVVATDTHAAAGPWLDLNEGVEAARELAERSNVFGIVGPQNVDLAQRVVAIARGAGKVHISGGFITRRQSSDTGCSFQLHPLAATLAGALAERIVADGVRHIAVMATIDAYGSTLSHAVVEAFEQLGGRSDVPVSFQPGLESYASVVNAVVKAAPEAVVLIGYPGSVSTIVQEWQLLGLPHTRWYLAPSLRSRELLFNVPPGALEGAVGVAAGTDAEDADEMRISFMQRFQDSEPTVSGYYYFDSVAVLALAQAAARVASGGEEPTYREICARVREVSNAPGETIRWNELDRGLELLEQGEEINYRGLGGSLELNDAGDVERSLVETWIVEEGQFKTLSVREF